MKIPKLTYYQFLMLPESERLYYQDIINVSHRYDVDCKQWTHGNVKDAQTALQSPTYLTVLEVAQMESERINQDTEFHIVLGMFNSICESIKQISEIEQKGLSGEMEVKHSIALQKVGGFDVFGNMPETLQLVKLLNQSYEEVRNLNWGFCFSVLMYEKRCKDYERELYKND